MKLYNVKLITDAFKLHYIQTYSNNTALHFICTNKYSVNLFVTLIEAFDQLK